MKQFFNTPGLIHIGEMIFEQLNNKSLESCSNVCLDWKKMLDNPRTWLRICIKKAPKYNEIDEKYKAWHFEASTVLINQWKQLILEAGNEYENQVANLLKKMYSDQSYKRISGDKTSFRSPIYMALLVEDLPLIRYLLLAYTNCFLSNRKSETISFYDVAKSSMGYDGIPQSQNLEVYSLKFCKSIAEKFFYVTSDVPILNSYHPPCPEVIEYLVSRLPSNRKWKSHSPNNLRTALEINQELQNFLKFLLEYIAANYPDSTFPYHFLYKVYQNLGLPNIGPNIYPTIALKICCDVNQPEKFKYGIHSYLLYN